jgi:arsenate reductase-like glutaredoxin family protein
LQLRDPSLSDEEAKKALVARQNDLIKRKVIGTEQWLKEKEAAA